jgi:hypothetical protein
MIDIEVKFHSIRAGAHQNPVKGLQRRFDSDASESFGGGRTATVHSPFDANGSVAGT